MLNQLSHLNKNGKNLALPFAKTPRQTPTPSPFFSFFSSALRPPSSPEKVPLFSPLFSAPHTAAGPSPSTVFLTSTVPTDANMRNGLKNDIGLMAVPLR